MCFKLLLNFNARDDTDDDGSDEAWDKYRFHFYHLCLLMLLLLFEAKTIWAHIEIG